jgi:hypothetical protein
MDVLFVSQGCLQGIMHLSPMEYAEQFDVLLSRCIAWYTRCVDTENIPQTCIAVGNLPREIPAVRHFFPENSAGEIGAAGAACSYRKNEAVIPLASGAPLLMGLRRLSFTLTAALLVFSLAALGCIHNRVQVLHTSAAHSSEDFSPHHISRIDSLLHITHSLAPRIDRLSEFFPWSPVLIAMGKAGTNHALRLQGAAFTTSEEENSLLCRGEAPAEKNVQDFAEELAASPLFSRVQIKDLSMENTTWRFSLSATLSDRRYTGTATAQEEQ